MKIQRLIAKNILRFIMWKFLFRRRRLIYLFGITLLTVKFLSMVLEEQIHNVIKEVQKKTVSEIDVMSWTNQKYNTCSEHFTGYNHQLAMLTDVIIKPNDQNFYILCDSGVLPLRYWFDSGKEGTHLNTWLNHLRSYRETKLSQEDVYKSNSHTTVVVLRYEYANLYHTMTDWYNVFLLTKLLNISVDDVSILLYDNHTKGHFDQTWSTLFGNIMFHHRITKSVIFKNLAWNILGYESPISWHGLKYLPFIDEFHAFFIQKHNISKTKDLNCDKVSMLFLWRRDYVAHPNNPTGLVSRKVKNEDELLTFFKKHYPSADVKGVQLDKLSFTEQLLIITSTDILISMHGAGLSHILFLPGHAAVVELFTLSWTKFFGLVHFKAMARWRGLKYHAWQNMNPVNEYDNGYTYISPISLDQHVGNLHNQLCSNH